MDLIPRKFYLGDDFFSDFFEPSIKNSMKCDVFEKNGKYNFILDIPGYDKNEINIECDNGYLTIKAEKNEEEKDESKNYIRRERRFGSFSRSFYVGDVDQDTIEAEFKNGTLKIVVPILEEKTTKKQIEIKD